MPKGIVRAADRVAVWHQAVEKFPTVTFGDGSQSSEPTSVASTPPAGDAPEPLAPAISKSKKFTAPANALKKTLDTTAHPSGGYHPESTKAIEGWGAKYPDFTKSYFKPQYADMVKAHVGDENYAKLHHHAPTPYTDALTIHQQAPAPNSKKFTYPANQLKKLLDDPHTETSHVQDWLGTTYGAGFAKTYLKPNYADALKGHLGEKNYAELQKHLSAPEKAQEQGQSEQSLGQKAQAIHPTFDAENFDSFSRQDQQKALQLWADDFQDEKKKQQFQQLHDEHFGQPPQAAPQGLGDKLKAVHEGFDSSMWNSSSPEQQKKTFQNWLQAAPHHYPPEKVQAAKDVFNEHFGQPSQDDPGSQHYQKLMKAVAPGSDAGKVMHTPEFKEWFHQKYPNADEDKKNATPSPSGLYKLFQKELGAQQVEQPQFSQQHQNLLHFTKGNANWAGLHEQTLKSPEFKQWFDAQSQHYQDKAVLSPSLTMNDFAAQSGQSSDQDEIGKIQEQMQPGGQQPPAAALQPGQEGMLDAWKKEHPDWQPEQHEEPEWLQGHPYASAWQQYQALPGEDPDDPQALQSDFEDWATHNGPFRPSQQQPGQKQQHEEPVAQDAPMSAALFNGIKKVFPGTGLDPYESQDQAKQQLESWLKYLPDHEGYAQHVPQLQALYDQHFGGQGGQQPSAQPEPEPLQDWEQELLDQNQPPQQQQSLGDALHYLTSPKGGSFMGPTWDGWTPEKQKEKLLDHINGGQEGPEKDQLEEIYKQHFGDLPGVTPEHTFNPNESTENYHGEWQHNEVSLPPGLKGYAEEHGIPLHSYAPWELQNLLDEGWDNLSPQKKQQYADAAKVEQGLDKTKIPSVEQFQSWGLYPEEAGYFADQSPQSFWGNVTTALKYTEHDPDHYPSGSVWGKITKALATQQGSEQPQQSTQAPFDWDTFGPEFKAIWPKSSWVDTPQNEQAAQAKLKSNVESAMANFPDSEKTQQAKALYQKYFPNGIPQGADQGEDLNKFFNENFGEPESPPEPAKPFKGEQLNPEDLAQWAQNKPQSAADWKNFSQWWGNTQLSPQDEQGLYQGWFDKAATPEQANQWFQSVFEHNSTPSDADLGSGHVPGWAHNSWAMGTKADAEWPAFAAWAQQHPGIPSGTSIKQKLQIWNGLSEADKTQIAGDYAPSSPVDTKGVLKALKAAYPDSNWAKWSQMSQGTLAKNVQALAEKGYPGAIPVFNQFFGGDVAMPEETPPEEASEQPVAPSLPSPEEMPPWLQPQLAKATPGNVEKLTKEFVGLSHFADSIGQGEAVTGEDKPNELGKVWNGLPSHLKAQISQMSNPPWHDMAGFEQWVQAQPTVTDAIKQAVPGWLKENHYPWHTGSGYDAQKQLELGKLIEKADPETKQQLLAIQHQFFGTGKTTLAETLSSIDPDQDWDKLLQTKSKTSIGNLLKKQLKTEQDPVKWAQLANAWKKHFAHPEKGGDVAPTGVKALTDFFKYKSPGKLDAGQLSSLIKYKEDNPNNENDWMGGHYGDPHPAAQALADADDGKTHLPFYGWTPPSDGSGGSAHYTPDPALLGKQDTTSYTAPAAEQKATPQYQGLLDRADSMASGFFSAKDKATLKGDGFANWFTKAPLAYRQKMQDHPGGALDDYDAFMSGGQPYQDVPDKPASGKEKFLDVSPFAMVPSKGKGTLPSSQTRNPSRGDFVKFPQYQDAQETLPLGPGERWSPQYAPLPIYRVMNLNLDHQPDADRAPAHLKGKEKQLWAHQQNARLRRIDEIVNGSSTVRNSENDLAHLKSWGSKYGLSDKEVNDVAGVLFGQQPDLFTDDKWAHLESFAKSKGIDPAEMHDLAQKLEVTPPAVTKGTYDHPELGPLILDYLENTAHRSDSGSGGEESQGGLGWHWTRAINKMYKGIPAAGINPGNEMKGTRRNIPVAISGLWGGQGEGGGHGGAYDPSHQGELEHNLYSHAPVHIRRVQIRSPGPEHGGSGAWHDTIDHGPMSLWGPGRYEEGDEKSGISGEQVPYKPSLAKELTKTLGTSMPKDMDTLVPGHQADAVFTNLLHKYPAKKDQILTLYQEHFVGRPDLPTKPHTRRASVQDIPRLAALDERNPAHLYDLATSWGVKSPERYGIPYLRELASDLKGVGWATKEMVKEHGLGLSNPRRQPSGTTVAAIEARIMRLATVLDELPSPDWMSAHGVKGYDDPEEIKSLYENNPNSWVFQQWKDDQGIEDESPHEGSHYDPDDDEYDDEDDYDPDDFHGDPPMPTMDRPKGWPQQAPWLKNDPRGRQYFPPHGLNGPSDSAARPDIDWQEETPEHSMLPIPRDFIPGQQPGVGGQHQLFDVGEAGHEWPNDTQATPLYRGFQLNLSHPDLASVRRALTGQDGFDARPGLFDPARPTPHPAGYDNANLGEHILNHVQNTGRTYQGQPGYGMGPHWSTSESTAQGFANTMDTHLKLPTVVRAQWKGLGEDPYRTNTQGHWDTENEVTMLPGAKMNIDSVKIQHPQTKAWHEVLPQPTEKHANRFSSPHAPVDDDEHAARYYFQTPANEMVQDWHDVKPWHREDAPTLNAPPAVRKPKGSILTHAEMRR